MNMKKLQKKFRQDMRKIDFDNLNESMFQEIIDLINFQYIIPFKLSLNCDSNEEYFWPMMSNIMVERFSESQNMPMIRKLVVKLDKSLIIHIINNQSFDNANGNVIYRRLNRRKNQRKEKASLLFNIHQNSFILGLPESSNVTDDMILDVSNLLIGYLHHNTSNFDEASLPVWRYLNQIADDKILAEIFKRIIIINNNHIKITNSNNGWYFLVLIKNRILPHISI